MATEKYVNGTGLGYLWTKMKATFLLSAEEISSPDMVNKKFATIDETNPHGCGNSITTPSPGMQDSSRPIIPLQVSPDFNGSTGCYIYQCYTSSSQRVLRTTYQLNSSGKLYTIPSSGSPSLVTSLSNIISGTYSGGFYVLQDTEYGNWWLSTTNATIDAEALGIVAQSSSGGGTSGGDPVPVPPDESVYYITGTTVDSTQLSDTPSDWWASDNAYAYIRVTDDMPFSMFHFTTAVTTNGGTRVCHDISDGALLWTYTLTRTNASTISISRTHSHITPVNPE